MNTANLLKFLRRYPILTAFIVAIAVTNIWKMIKSMDTIENPSADETLVNTAVTTEVQTDVMDTALMTTAMTTTEPVPVFQSVDNSYFDDALFIGDSRTEGLALYGSLTNADYFSSVGLSIYGVTDKPAGNPNLSESVTLTEKLASRQYGKIYIMLGLNELGTGTAESWAETYADVVAQVRQAQPDAIIYLESILLVAASQDDPTGSINNATVRERNEALAGLENKADHIYYLEVNEAVADANGCLDSSLTNDGIHLTGTALSVWEDYLKTHTISTDDTPAIDVFAPSTMTESAGVPELS